MDQVVSLKAYLKTDASFSIWQGPLSPTMNPTIIRISYTSKTNLVDISWTFFDHTILSFCLLSSVCNYKGSLLSISMQSNENIMSCLWIKVTPTNQIFLVTLMTFPKIGIFDLRRFENDPNLVWTQSVGVHELISLSSEREGFVRCLFYVQIKNLWYQH